MFRCDGDKLVTGAAKHVNRGVEAERKKGHILRNEHKTNAFCHRSVCVFLLVLNKLFIYVVTCCSM
jgi:hypothetical protein